MGVPGVFLGINPDSHMIWCGNFHCHHPMWDEECNSHLFTAAAMTRAKLLNLLIANFRMSRHPLQEPPCCSRMLQVIGPGWIMYLSGSDWSTVVLSVTWTPSRGVYSQPMYWCSQLWNSKSQ